MMLPLTWPPTRLLIDWFMFLTVFRPWIFEVGLFKVCVIKGGRTVLPRFRIVGFSAFCWTSYG